MASNNLTPFANGDGANVVDETTWQGDSLSTVRSAGFQSGIAKSAQVNRVLAQGASAGYAIGELIKDYAAEDATIDASALYSGFVDALKALSKQAVIDVVFPVGSVYISTASTNPATLFGIGTWERIGSGRTLIDAGGGFTAGSTGGADTHRLTVNEMPAHNHTAWTEAAGNHAHNRGNMNITGYFGSGLYTRYFVNEAGAFYATDVAGTKGMDDGGSMKSHYQINFDASRAWSGETSWQGQHNHAVGVDNTGGSQAFSVRNPYLAVYIWKRVA
nr:MAG TPA: baseplate wedge protein [Caudoviricetes sp.]